MTTVLSLESMRALTKTMETSVAQGAYTLLRDYVGTLFQNPRSDLAVEATVAGLAVAVRMYERQVGRPIADLLVCELLDTKGIK